MDKQDEPHRKAIEMVARLGYAAKGVVYIIIGCLAIMAALGLGGKATGAKGAIQELATQPFGQLLLLVLAGGLVGHVIWRATEALADPENKGTSFTGIVTRIGFGLSGAIYASLAGYTLTLVVGAFMSTGSDSAEERTATAMAYPGGPWLVGAAGVGFIGIGIYQGWRAYGKRYQKAWDRHEMSETQWTWANHIARAGLSARAVVFTLTGFLLLVAAIKVDPEQAADEGGALQILAQQPYGWLLLGLIAAGLVCYGIYCFTNARFRHINP